MSKPKVSKKSWISIHVVESIKQWYIAKWRNIIKKWTFLNDLNCF